ncbi:RNA polymerase sigma factor [Nocardia sp. BMG111209]|uniref:RNA polymerase sigma factor n=1 Tax=Nocardia sp. BMG111209 TaxID=1160137 RepID=UPI000370299F|nr:RNA polymerase sigma factor [Nocardia sp. BMG111209]
MTDVSSPPQPDHELVQRLRAGDLDGLRDLHTEYAPALHAYCVSRLGEYDEADDVVHHTMLTAWSRMVHLREPEALRAWLFAIARNECRRRLGTGTGADSLPNNLARTESDEPGRQISGAGEAG